MPTSAELKAAAKRNAAYYAEKQKGKLAKLKLAEAALKKLKAERAAKEIERQRREYAASQRNRALADARTQANLEMRAIDCGFRTELPTASRYVVTAAQNNTPVHAEFLACLKTYCKRNKAELVVLPYRNPTSVDEADEADEKESWDESLQPYLFAGRVLLNKEIGIMGDLKTQPTRSSPLAGLDAMSYASSAIFGHPKVELKTVPTPVHKLPKILTTTGAITLPNFSDSVVGKISEFHHSQAAVVVELSGDKFFLRQINADKETGEFTDLNGHYTPKAARIAMSALALVLGDTHVGFVDPGVQEATFGKNGMVQALRPQHIVYHDLLDGYSCNPHHAGNPFNLIAKELSGSGNVRAEVERACQYVLDSTPLYSQPVIVASNHDDFLRRWIHSADWKKENGNQVFYLETALEMARATKMGDGGTETPSPFAMWVDKLMPEGRVKLVGANSFSLAGVELSLHGDRGPNGSRGSIKNLRRIGTKIIIGHSHSPGISEGAFQTGTSSLLRLEYNSGPSSWAHAHCVLYATGKRSLLFIVGEDWRL